LDFFLGSLWKGILFIFFISLAVLLGVSLHNMKSIVVFCGASPGADPVFLKEAFEFGQLLAKRQIQLIYGGASIGVMGAVADGCLEAGGQVIGIIPEFFVTKEVAHEALSDTVVVKTMHERKLAMYKMADGVVVLPGGFGTMDEFFEILTWSQLGMHQMPIGLLNSANYYTPLLQFMNHAMDMEFVGEKDRNLVVHHSNATELLDMLASYVPTPRKIWVKLEEL
jgi:uncharacterized protein (TIGR00730 family)